MKIWLYFYKANFLFENEQNIKLILYKNILNSIYVVMRKYKYYDLIENMIFKA